MGVGRLARRVDTNTACRATDLPGDYCSNWNARAKQLSFRNRSPRHGCDCQLRPRASRRK